MEHSLRSGDLKKNCNNIIMQYIRYNYDIDDIINYYNT